MTKSGERLLRSANQALAYAKAENAPKGAAFGVEEGMIKAWTVFVNTDLTEGRGSQRVAAVCETEATARRLASKADVQGTDGRVVEVELILHGDLFYGPVTLVKATPEDKQVQTRLDRRREAEAHAKELGLTEDDLAALRAG